MVLIMEKQTIKSIQIGEEIIELPFPVEIVPYYDNSGMLGSIAHQQVVQLTQVVIELIKGFMERTKE